MVKRLQARWRARKVVKWPLYKRLLVSERLAKTLPVSSFSLRGLSSSRSNNSGKTRSGKTHGDGLRGWLPGWAARALWGASSDEAVEAARAASARQRAATGFKERGHATKLTRLLQLLCENHSNELQTLLAEQPDAGYGSINLVAEVLNLLKELEVGVDRSDIALTTQCAGAIRTLLPL